MIYGKLIFEWLVFILIFGFAIYTMRVIKNEKNNFLKEAREIHFKYFKLQIPKWWGEIPTDSENKISFKRLDTRYDWQANFIWSETSSSKDIVELFKDHINERKILFDEDTSIVYNPSDFKSGPLIQTGNFEIVRLEGTATCDRVERLYYDAFLVRNKIDHKFLYAESVSSVLNGLVEGPYFEEVMLRIESTL
jgi:hypothetical protein